jgi:hypothetical protein
LSASDIESTSLSERGAANTDGCNAGSVDDGTSKRAESLVRKSESALRMADRSNVRNRYESW